MYIVNFFSKNYFYPIRKMEFDEFLKENIMRPFSVECSVAGDSSYLIATSDKITIDFLSETLSKFLNKEDKEKLFIAEITGDMRSFGWVKQFRDWINENK